MDTQYLSNHDPKNTVFTYQGEVYTLPVIDIACVDKTATNKDDYHVKSNDLAILAIQKTIGNLINCEALDEAVKVTILYEGISFHHSMTLKDGLVYGKYGFLAEFFGQPCKVACVQDNAIAFVDPQEMMNKLCTPIWYGSKE